MKWWKSNGLHKIKTKPIVVVRVTANDAEEVQKWFKRYRRTLRKYGFEPKDIINFDEAGFRVGCPKGQWILVPEDIKELYASSPEDRRSVTIIKAIAASGGKPPPPFIIM